MHCLLAPENLTDHDINEALQKMAQSLENYLRSSSGWVIKRVLHLKIHTVRYTPLIGSSYIEFKV